jgi:hypothetical protein
MMDADEVRRIAYQDPFKPFRVKLVSGESFNIERSLRCTVWVDRVLFGVDEDAETRIAKRLRIVALRDIAAVEEVTV